MEPEAARRFHDEAGNWLSRGRGHVIEALLARHRPAAGRRRSQPSD